MVRRNTRSRGRGRGGAFRGKGGGLRGRVGGFRGTRQPNNSNVLSNNVKENFEAISWVADSPDSALQNLFLQKSTILSHYEAQKNFPNRYFACLHVLMKNSVQILENSKALVLAAAWARNDYPKAKYMLQIPGEMFSIKEVLKAITLLDSARSKRAHEKIVRRLEVQGCKKKMKMAKLKAIIGSLEANILPVGSLSGALIRHIKHWLKTIPVDRLEFFAAHFPLDAWKKLADLCHLHPEKDMPQCTWFLPFCYGKPAPKKVVGKGVINSENICELLLTQDIDYTVAREWKDSFNEKAKERIATYTKLDTVLWYYEELGCDAVDKVMLAKFEGGEKLSLPYGKLMERLLYFEMDDEKKPFLKYLTDDANSRLKQLSFRLEEPVVVIGDISASMGVAFRTSNIIASLLVAVTKAELVFFDEENVFPSFIPDDVQGVLRLCEEMRERGSTAPVVSLYPYYEQKKVVKTFVIVTDEKENAMHHNYYFHNLFKLYYDEVYPARLVFISFLSQNNPGLMVTRLKEHAPEIKALQFRFNGSRPDLTKLDNVFGLLSADSEQFKKETDDVEKLMLENNMSTVMETLKL